ncbi:MAG: hypothetical protein KIT43_15485 [Bauldia sp.]|nr:hypothetical protein [Bauldia sp.]MCW5718119.1 hypothetical protein [Bauldia sp.]
MVHILLIVGVFRSKSEADNARHRLVTEGIAKADIIERVIGPGSSVAEPLTEDLARRYALIPPGDDTLVAVRVPSVEQAEAVESIMMMFEPKQVDRHDIVAGRIAISL